MNFYSQYGQDKYIFETYFSNYEDGTYIDIGANDGVKLSNTLFFEQNGWSGYCFEPIPDVYDKLKINRPRAKVFNCAIGHENKEVEFLWVNGEAEMLSSVLDYCNHNHLFRINSEAHENKDNLVGMPVQMSTLDNFVPINEQIDYLSLDTEGGEPQILEHVLSIYSPTIISVEVNYNSEFDQLMKVIKGKYEVEKRLGCDFILKKI